LGERIPSALTICFYPRHIAYFFAREFGMKRNSEGLAAQIHHLIRKRFCHLIRKINLE
jgi:hypothetical protein